MKLDKGLLLFGKPIPLTGLGTVKSPKLRDIFDGFESWASFSFLRTVILGSAKSLREMIRDIRLTSDYSDMSDLSFDKASKYELIAHSPTLREFFARGLDLFVEEEVEWVDEYGLFALKNAEGSPVGVIGEKNYDEAESVFAQLVGQDKDEESDLKFASPEAKRLWEEHNRFEEDERATNSQDYSIQNIVSKLSCGITGYTLFTIFDLTVYQLFNQFQAYAQCRSASLGEAAYAHWGGEDFDLTAWLRSNLK